MFSCKNIFVPTNPEVRAPRIMAGNQRFCDHLQAQLCVFVSISGETSQWKEAGAVNVAVCAWDPSPREAKADGSWVQGLPVLCREILSQINTNRNNKRNNAGRLRFFFCLLVAFVPCRGLEDRSSVMKLCEFHWDKSMTATAGRKSLLLCSDQRAGAKVCVNTFPCSLFQDTCKRVLCLEGFIKIDFQ